MLRARNRRRPGAGWRLEGSDGPSELESLSVFLFAHGQLQRLAGGQSLTADSALTLKGRSTHSVSLGGCKGFFFFFLPATTDFLSSQSKTGESSRLDIALITASSSWLSIAPTTEAHLLPLIHRWVRGSKLVKATLLSLCSIHYYFYWVKQLTPEAKDKRPQSLLLTELINQTNQTANEGRDLHESTSRRPSFCLAIPTLSASLGSVTDTLNYNWDCACANDSCRSWWPRHGQSEDQCLRRNRCYEGIYLWLEGSLGFETRMVILKLELD